MNPLKHKIAAWTAVAALGATSLFAASTAPARNFHRQGRMGAFMANYLNLTADQQAKDKAIFQSARQSAQPVRQELRQTRQSLHSAIQANNSAEIQKLAKVEGTELGQLAAIRSNAMAKSYQVLTSQQKQELAKLQEARRAARPGRWHSTAD